MSPVDCGFPFGKPRLAGLFCLSRGLPATLRLD